MNGNQKSKVEMVSDNELPLKGACYVLSSFHGEVCALKFNNIHYCIPVYTHLPGYTSMYLNRIINYSP